MSDLRKYYQQFQEDRSLCEKEMDVALKKFFDKYYSVIDTSDITLIRGAYWNRHVKLKVTITPEIIIK